MMPDALKVVGPQNVFPEVDLTEPSDTCFLHIAATIDKRHPLLPMSQRKSAVIQASKKTVSGLKEKYGLVDASVFKAALIPPGGGGPLLKKSKVHVADFDFAILIECPDRDTLGQLLADESAQEMLENIKQHSSFYYQVTASNIKKIGPVDHSRQGVFLFNYFYADDTAQNLAVWKYTAGWFQQETHLDNSTVLLPDEGLGSPYNIINHCRWNSLLDVLPSLAFKKSFKNYVLANFSANNVVPMPILYRLA